MGFSPFWFPRWHARFDHACIKYTTSGGRPVALPLHVAPLDPCRHETRVLLGPFRIFSLLFFAHGCLAGPSTALSTSGRTTRTRPSRCCSGGGGRPCRGMTALRNCLCEHVALVECPYCTVADATDGKLCRAQQGGGDGERPGAGGGGG